MILSGGKHREARPRGHGGRDAIPLSRLWGPPVRTLRATTPLSAGPGSTGSGAPQRTSQGGKNFQQPVATRWRFEFIGPEEDDAIIHD
jgi:hypothetical protein